MSLGMGMSVSQVIPFGLLRQTLLRPESSMPAHAAMCNDVARFLLPHRLAPEIASRLGIDQQPKIELDTTSDISKIQALQKELMTKTFDVERLFEKSQTKKELMPFVLFDTDFILESTLGVMMTEWKALMTSIDLVMTSPNFDIDEEARDSCLAVGNFHEIIQEIMKDSETKECPLRF